MGSPSEDIALMQRLAAGDDMALTAIMDRWKGRIGAFLFRSTGDHETAVDLTQETFVNLYKSRKKYRPTGTFSTFLFQIASNLARSHARWKARHPHVPLHSEDGTLIHEPADPHLAPDASTLLKEQANTVRSAIDSLPQELRRPLLLSILEEMSHAEIAKVLGCSEKAVELRIYRARQSLKASFPAGSS